MTWVVYGALRIEDYMNRLETVVEPGRLFFILQPRERLISPILLHLLPLVSTPNEQANLVNLVRFLVTINENLELRNSLFNDTASYVSPQILCSSINEKLELTLNMEVWSPVGIQGNGSILTTYTPATMKDEIPGLKSRYSFNNQTLRVCVPEYVPFLHRKYPNQSYEINNVSGFLKNIIVSLMKELHFQIYIYEPPDGEFGVKVPNQTVYSGCVGQVQTQNATFAAGVFTFTAERNQVVDYTVPIMSDPMIIMFQKPKEKSQWWGAFRSVSPTIWGLTLASLLIMVIVSTILSRLSPFSAYNLSLPYSIRDEVQIMENLWNAIGIFMLQGQEFYVYSLSARMVTVTWWMFSAIFLAIYSADLTSFITTYSGPVLPKTLQEFADSDTLRLYLTRGFASTSNIYMLSNETTNVACVSDYSWTLYIKTLQCDRFGFIREVIEAAFTGFIVTKHADFKEDFDRIIQRLSDSGIIQKWFQEDLKEDGGSINSNTICAESLAKTAAIDFHTTGGIFIVTSSLYVTGITILFLECIYVRIRRQK